ncbi:MAG TPA: phosphoadenosine phosphosulfate reductase family protein [Gallicola sp.]|nr:phosphoadenosine phosphosulfate reductase family protein [Gallicola sp.]
MQAWSLERKIQVTQTRIIEWYQFHEGKCYVSFSGGKDSTVLADLSARVCKSFNYKLILWFSDTGLEYPELKKHTKDYVNFLEDKYNIEVELVVDYPKDKQGNRITFKEVLLKHGYPLISKTISRQIHDVKKHGKECWAWRCFDENIDMGIYNMEKWKYLIDSPFKISNECCTVMKKTPAKKFTKKSGLYPIIGTMACESKQRKNNWIKTGCNAFDKGSPSSQPISFWTEQDVLKYIKDFNIPYASVYGDIIEENGIYKTTGLSRTGCVFCGYGCHLEKEPNRFQLLKQTHPKLWEYCMKPISEGGLGMKEVLEYIGVKID